MRHAFDDRKAERETMQIYVYGQPRDTEQGFEDYLDPTKTAVVSIDMHRGHLDPSAGLPVPGAARPRHRGADRRLPRRASARSAFRSSMSARYCGAAASTTSTASVRPGGAPFRCMSAPLPNSDAHAIEGSPWTEFVTQVGPDDLIVETKKRLSAFYPTDLDFLLRNMRVETIVLNGGFTDCCVLNTAFDASNHNYRVIVMRDLVRGTDDHLEAAALAMVSLHLGLVTDSADLLGEWDRRMAARDPNTRPARARG